MSKPKEPKDQKEAKPATKLTPFKSVTWVASTVLSKGGVKNVKKVSKQQEYANGRLVSMAGDMSLIQAARDGLVDTVNNILGSGIAHMHDMDEDGFTALHHAARYNRVEVMEALIDAGADLNFKGGQDETRPLHMAARYNNGGITQLLLARGADVNMKDIKGKTSLHCATRRGHNTVIKMLLSVTSCDVNKTDNDNTTPLIMAALTGNTSVCELLISRGADLRKPDVNDMTALMWAAAEGHYSVCEVLLKAVARAGRESELFYVQARDNEGHSALHLAVENGSLEVCELLIAHFADVNAHKHNLSTSLHIAATHGYLDITKALLLHGADVNSRNVDQMTPIHKASLYNKVQEIELLMKSGGDINSKDKKNMSPLHCASWKGQSEAVTFLLDNGAQVAEVDSSLKTALHWAVQYGHYETLLILLKNGGSLLLDASDKNDQTVLHYAAHMGNISVLKTLLESGARTDAKDQEERTPLHVAAQYDNVNCVEALIQASGHETNDDDMDGRTPLLLACTYGHHQVVQLLLSLGADISKRDDDHCTVLMLAAAKGHTQVMRLLLENHASVNESDKLKNTALHYACAGGHVEAVQLLLDRRAVVTLKNTHDMAPLGMAIDNQQNDVAIAMLKHKSWRECLAVRDMNGVCVLDRLIAKLPDAAMLVLDHCVERTSRDEDDPNLMMVFDYQYLDPGPDDVSNTNARYFALNTMVLHERDQLLSHPLCQSLLSQKWVRYGRNIFGINLFIYLGYLISLMCYALLLEDSAVFNATVIFDDFSCPIYLSEADQKNETLVGMLKTTGQNREERTIPSGSVTFYKASTTLFITLFLIREVFKLLHQKMKYLLNFFNWIAWILMAATFYFLHSDGSIKPCLKQWRAGWVALFFAWINFIMYLRRIDFVGIYVIMFVTVLVSLLKAVIVYLLFSFAFACSFYIVMGSRRRNVEHDHSPYTNLATTVLNVFVMTLGEIEYADNYLPVSELEPFANDVNILLVIFLFLMPIVLMNLMIGIAVGDIEKVQHNAYLKRIGLQVDLLYQLESGMPFFLQKKVYTRRAAIKPNAGGRTRWHKMSRDLLGSSRNMQFIQAEEKDRMTHNMEQMNQDMHHQQQRIRNIQMTLQQQTLLLQQLCAKMDITESGGAIPDITPASQTDQMSLYDNISTPQFNRDKQRSIRDSSLRPKSINI